MSTVTVDNVGAIGHIEFDLPPEKGGVKVLCGSSGSGKTTVLRAMNGLLGSKDDLAMLSPSDGSERGEIVGLGRTVKIGQRVQSTGSASVPHLGGRLDIATLVEPRVADAAARVKARVRCLVSIGGATIKPEDLLGDKAEEFGSLVDLDELRSSDDPVQMADKLKRMLDQLALTVERDSDRKAGAAAAKRQEAGDMDTLQGVGDYQEMVASHREALLSLSAAKEAKSRFEMLTNANKQLESQIAERRGAYTGPDPATLEEGLAAKKTIVDGLTTRLRAAEVGMAEAKKTHDAAVKHFAEIQRMEKQVLDPGLDIPDSIIADKEAEEGLALQNLQNAGSIQTRKAALEESKKLQKESSELGQQSADLRLAAQQVQMEVQKALPAGPIQVQDGLLVVQHGKRRKRVPFDDLSTGERWKVAMSYAIQAVGEGGVIPLVQESWQSLSPELQVEVAEMCREARVWMITATVTDGELRVVDLN